MNIVQKRSRLMEFLIQGLWVFGLFFLSSCSKVILSRVGQDQTERAPASSDREYYRYMVRTNTPRLGCGGPRASCSQANDCCSNLCTGGKCVARVFPVQCLDIGEYYSTTEDCCSKFGVNGVCVGLQDSYCGYVGQSCYSRLNCCSDQCSISTGVCSGNSTGQRECAIVEQECDVGFDSQCCSGSCTVVPGSIRGKCIGGGRDLGRSSEICRYDNQCLSNKCHNIGSNGLGTCI